MPPNAGLTGSGRDKSQPGGLGTETVLVQNGGHGDRFALPSMDALPFPTGRPPPRSGPLARFLPPLEAGTARRALSLGGPQDAWVLDPFGVSPRLTVELAAGGIPVVTACNNPVTRFILEGTAQPIPVADLRTGLARLATAPKDNVRLERFILDLYLTTCSQCKALVPAERFIWDRDQALPVVRTYSCPQCGHAADESTTTADRDLAASHARRGLQHALALEQLSSAGDSDREHAEAALAVYPGRAVFALITLVSKSAALDLEPPIRRAVDALLLSVFDATNALWSYPEGRIRPRQLTASPHFVEWNAWRALEKAVAEWDLPAADVPLDVWTAGAEPQPGRLAVFAGPSRDLAGTLAHGQVRHILTVLPRPNQAYWTLSALWAAWLWGREAAAPIRVVLRRRRYDWAWHASALRAAMAGLAPVMADEVHLTALLPESEPGFVAAACLGFDAAGFEMTGVAVRAEEGQAVLRWKRRTGSLTAVEADTLVEDMKRPARQVIETRGEPTPYACLHAAAWGALASDGLLAPLLQAEEARSLTLLNDRFETVLGDRRTFVLFGAGAEAEIGRYWLADPATAGVPLADRVEEVVFDQLQAGGSVAEEEVEVEACRRLPGWLTPDRRLIQACLRSYAVPGDEAGSWRLRAEDEPATRARDLEEVIRLLHAIGGQLGYAVEARGDIFWLDALGTERYAFRVRNHAGFGEALRDAGEVIHVLPGGRGPLVAEKVRRDPRLRAWMQAGLRLVKFRHIRRLAVETTLTRDNLEARLAIDPIHESDPQLPLL